jgi:hypothetical protein
LAEERIVLKNVSGQKRPKTGQPNWPTKRA